MHVLFYDVHNLLGTFRAAQPYNIAELLYADDTLLLTISTQHMHRILHRIESESETYNMELNKDKCAYIAMDRYNNIKFADGSTWNARRKPHT